MSSRRSASRWVALYWLRRKQCRMRTSSGCCAPSRTSSCKGVSAAIEYPGCAISVSPGRRRAKSEEPELFCSSAVNANPAGKNLPRAAVGKRKRHARARNDLDGVPRWHVVPGVQKFLQDHFIMYDSTKSSTAALTNARGLLSHSARYSSPSAFAVGV